MASQGPSPHSQPGSQTQSSGTPVPALGASPAAGSSSSSAASASASQSSGQPAQPPPPQQQSQTDLDAISRVKVLVPQLKQSLSTLMNISAIGFHYSAMIDNASPKTLDVPAQRFDKSLEEFYSICDQVELHLKLALDCSTQYVEGRRHTPLQIPSVKSDTANPGESQTYNQYVITVKSQVAYAKDIHDALLECSNKLGEGKT